MDYESVGKLIGEGWQGKIYYYKGYAYKVFKEDYPVEYIDYEFNIQNEINKSSLKTVKYYKTDDKHVLKMDYINGITMSDKIKGEKGFKNGLIEMIKIQKQIHCVENLKLQKVNNFFKEEINKSILTQEYKTKALQKIERIKEKNNLCHLDFHPLNIMYCNGEYIIIDWPNAKCGNPIHDFARTYVILYENAFRLSKTYLSLLEKDIEVDNKELKDAIFISALIRYNEYKNEKLLKLLEEN